MAFQMRCPGCGKGLRLKDEVATRKIKCPSCGCVFACHPQGHSGGSQVNAFAPPPAHTPSPSSAGKTIVIAGIALIIAVIGLAVFLCVRAIQKPSDSTSQPASLAQGKPPSGEKPKNPEGADAPTTAHTPDTTAPKKEPAKHTTPPQPKIAYLQPNRFEPPKGKHMLGGKLMGEPLYGKLMHALKQGAGFWPRCYRDGLTAEEIQKMVVLLRMESLVGDGLHCDAAYTQYGWSVSIYGSRPGLEHDTIMRIYPNGKGIDRATLMKRFGKFQFEDVNSDMRQLRYGNAGVIFDKAGKYVGTVFVYNRQAKAARTSPSGEKPGSHEGRKAAGKARTSDAGGPRKEPADRFGRTVVGRRDHGSGERGGSNTKGKHRKNEKPVRKFSGSGAGMIRFSDGKVRRFRSMAGIRVSSVPGETISFTRLSDRLVFHVGEIAKDMEVRFAQIKSLTVDKKGDDMLLASIVTVDGKKETLVASGLSFQVDWEQGATSQRIMMANHRDSAKYLGMTISFTDRPEGLKGGRPDSLSAHSRSGTVKFAGGKSRQFWSLAGIRIRLIPTLSGGARLNVEEMAKNFIFYGDGVGNETMMPIAKVASLKIAKKGREHIAIRVTSVDGTKNTLTATGAWFQAYWRDSVISERIILSSDQSSAKYLDMEIEFSVSAGRDKKEATSVAKKTNEAGVAASHGNQKAELIQKLIARGNQLLAARSPGAKVAYELASIYDTKNPAIQGWMKNIHKANLKYTSVVVTGERISKILAGDAEIIFSRWPRQVAEMETTELRILLDEKLVGNLECGHAVIKAWKHTKNESVTASIDSFWTGGGLRRQEILRSGWPRLSGNPDATNARVFHATFFMAKPELTLRQVKKTYGEPRDGGLSTDKKSGTIIATYGRLRFICRNGKVDGILLMGY
jgi:hypothetical protein